MSITINARGTSIPFFTIGKKGVTLYQGSSDPQSTYTMKNGDLWINDSTYAINTWNSTSSTWVPPVLNYLKFPNTDGTSGQVLSTNALGQLSFVNRVSTISVSSANGLSGSVSNPTTTPSITLSTSVSGMVKANGTAFSAATAGTDYSQGTSSLTTGILKSTTGTGALSIAVAADFPTLNQNTTGNSATSTLASKSSTLAQNGGSGAAMTFSYSGTGGQPTWLWGTNDGISMTVYNPTNFTVANSNALGNSITAAGGTFSSNLGTNAAMYTQAGMYWNAATGAYALNSQNWVTESVYQTVRIYNAQSHGDVSVHNAYHRPGVESFVQWNIGGSGNYFRMSNNGVGYSQGGWTNTSDIRVKTDLMKIKDPLDKISRLTGYTYLRTDMKGLNGIMPRKAGVIAQDVLEVLPEAVNVPDDYDRSKVSGNHLSLHDDGLTGLLVESIKELYSVFSKEIADLKDKIRILENK